MTRSLVNARRPGLLYAAEGPLADHEHLIIGVEREAVRLEDLDGPRHRADLVRAILALHLHVQIAISEPAHRVRHGLNGGAKRASEEEEQNESAERNHDRDGD